jgi:hypothetical protein
MVVRRIREHVATHNWFAVTVDLVIVIAGVFLGTQVNNWNESRIEARQAENYRRRLLQELDFNRRQYVAQVAYFESVMRYGERAVAEMDDLSVDPRGFVIDAFQLTQVDQAPGKSYIYQEMVSGGFVSGLGDERMQNLASDYYLNVSLANGLVDKLYPYRDLVRGLVPINVQRAIGQTCGDLPVMHDGRLVGLALRDKCAVEIEPDQARRIAAAIRSAPNMRTLMTRYIATIDEKLGTLRFNVGETETLVRELQRHSIRQS